MSDSIGIIVAPNGATKTQGNHSALPITPKEIADTVEACLCEGAAMVHLHSRDAHGRHSLEISDNLLTYQLVKERVGSDILVQLTTEAVGQYSPEHQMALIKAVKPEAASFAIKELIPNENYNGTAKAFFHWVAEQSIIPQYIVYSINELKRYLDLIENQILPKQNHHLLLVLGRYNEQLLSNPTDLLPYFPYLQQLSCRWAVCAFGTQELHCLTAAALLGGDVRIGFENNHLDLFGQPALSNAQQVKQLKNLLIQLNIETYDAGTYREKLFNSLPCEGSLY
ncbi:3-keto-5-aminohexanoate cleavage protein [Vibrio sp. ZSDE26]|uniref:3-keto-5-aminohexanoate cleavage protein n=1 Tax=Vibrio amylolyticus TaxID=2847292 RepID=A0A9X1XKK9_9VIBR|nr:3-keto-5-aminohexanoate cleavage protein [Vibrio amylolyticus]MCK6264662.1 3-keto-5-aminohexanoate cleavage protein [Vibrio amylolyticus]